MATTPLSKAAGHGGHHEVKFNHLVGNLLALMALMGITIWASYVNFGNSTVNNLIALLIASVKACLVIWIFMGVKFATPLTRLWVAVGFIVFILMFGILGDYATRRFEPTAGWELNRPNGGETALQREWPPAKKPKQGAENFRPRL